MKKLNKLRLVIAAMIVMLPYSAYSITVNPASNVLADSSNTSQTVMYRDTNNASGITQLNLTVQTTTQIGSLVPVTTGTIVAAGYNKNSGGGFSSIFLCISSNNVAGAWVMMSTGTTAGSALGNATQGNPCY